MKLSIIVPYRNRETHLKLFLNYMNAFLTHHGYDFEFIVVHQQDDLPFNRGELLNIGAAYSSGDYFAFHDVDMLPGIDVYQYPNQPTHAITRQQRHDFVPYCDLENQYFNHRYFSGVTLVSRSQYDLAGGYPSGFFGWGMEDDEFLRRLIVNGNLETHRRNGLFSELPHEDRSKGPVCQYLFVEDVSYKLINSEQTNNITHIKVELQSTLVMKLTALNVKHYVNSNHQSTYDQLCKGKYDRDVDIKTISMDNKV